jgi:hypothetical protein
MLKFLIECSNSFSKLKDGDVGPTTASGFPLKGMLVPNVEEFKIVHKLMDELAKGYGLSRARERWAEVTRLDKTMKPNKYLVKMYDRLNRYAKKGQQRKFETLHDRMLKHSISLQIVALCKVESKWYKRLDHSFIRYTMAKVQKLAKRKSTSYKYKRVLIPKSNGGLRPLAVPSLAWRVYANMRYHLLWIWLRNKNPWEAQHGGRPQKGVTSCWKALWKIIQNPEVKDIYEFDLTKFFDRVDTKYAMRDALAWKGIPKGISEWCAQTVENATGSEAYEKLVEEWDSIKESMSSYKHLKTQPGWD